MSVIYSKIKKYKIKLRAEYINFELLYFFNIA